MSLGLSWLLTGHLLSMTVAMGTGAMPIWKENWEQCSLRQKLHRGGGEGECLLLVLTLSCLFYPPPTHFHQTISLSNAEVKVCISYRSSWNRQGLCEMNIIARRAGALPGWLYLSLHNTATLSPLSFPLLLPSAERFAQLLGAPRGRRGGAGRGQLGKSNQLSQNQQIYCGFMLVRGGSVSVYITISTDREGGNNKHEDLCVLPVPPEHCEESRGKKPFL